ncbi:hypothetical protein [Ktedonospora formicarum]|uniref:Uncharacterized protein n=1 Tax=Ktedonospora formicarum TaxID=2778364 RepID=A0A8J3IAU4_9CHLR|nr:hypothetical protein [Ktedonospora formicarum]GHO48649.1 hypothetical protein KSX_68120 [Ktedonospora formicarum]
MLRPHQPPREALISRTPPIPAPIDAPFVGSWEWVLNWPEEAQRFLLQFAADGTLTLMSHRQHLPLGLGHWCALGEWSCQWEWYALVSSEDAPDTYGGEWHLWEIYISPVGTMLGVV